MWDFLPGTNTFSTVPHFQLFTFSAGYKAFNYELIAQHMWAITASTHLCWQIITVTASLWESLARHCLCFLKTLDPGRYLRKQPAHLHAALHPKKTEKVPT